MNTLFDITPIEKASRTEKCKECIYAQRWGYDKSPKIFWYCSAIKSKRTSNGLLKIKANQIACDKFQQ